MSDPIVVFAAMLFIGLVTSAFIDRIGAENIIVAVVSMLVLAGAIVLLIVDNGRILPFLEFLACFLAAIGIAGWIRMRYERKLLRGHKHP